MTLDTTVEEREKNIKLTFSNWGFQLSGKYKGKLKYTANGDAPHSYSVLSRVEHCFDVTTPTAKNLK